MQATLEEGVAALRNGDVATAKQQFEAALRDDERSIAAYIYLGVADNALKQFTEAVAALRHALQLDEYSEAAHYNLALSLLSLHRTAEAANEFRAAVRLNPKNASAHYNLASLLAQEGHLNEASVHLEEARKSKPDDESVWLQLATLYLKTNNHAGLAHLQAEGARNEVPASLHFGLGQLLLHSGDKQERAEGAKEVQTALNIDGTQSEYYLTLANYLFDSGNMKGTIALLKDALARVPPSVRIYVILGLAELELEGPTSAEPYIQKAIALDGSAGAGYDLMGRCRMRLDDNTGAAKYFTQAAQRTPGNDIFARDAAIALDKLGQVQNALPYAQQAVKLRPNDVYNHYILGKLYSQCDRRPEAVGQLETCIQLNPKNALPYNLLGTLYKRAGQPDKAAACWRTLRTLKESNTAEAEQSFSRFGSVPQ